MSKPNDKSAVITTPYSVEAEASVLGAGLSKCYTIAKAALLVSAEDFYLQQHRHIYDAMFTLYMSGDAVDALTVFEELKRRGQDEASGGRDYMDSVIAVCPNPDNIEDYARQVKRDSDARLLMIGLSRASAAASNGLGPDGALEIMRGLIDRMEMRRSFAGKQQDDTSEEDLMAIVSKVEWLWPGRIPRGYVTALIAETGQGKSFIAMDLCYRIRCGLSWPDGAPMPEFAAGERILWVETEGRHAIFIDRLTQWEGQGFPPHSFILPPNPAHSLQIDNESDLEWIERACARHRPSVIFVDSLSGSNSASENKADEQKKILQRLTTIATTYNVAIIIVHHLSKPQPGAPHWPITPSRMRGSSAIPQFCLSILAAGAPDASRLNDRALSCIKHNLAPDTPDLGYQIIGDNGFTIAWSDHAPSVPEAKPKAVELAEEFLREILSDGSKLSSAVRDEAAQRGISRSSLNRAILSLRIHATGKDSLGHNIMRLP